jgi:mono/diheme cytochrome c family protein
MLIKRLIVRLSVCVTGGALLIATPSMRAANPQQPTVAAPVADSSSPVRPVVQKYCAGCHNERLHTAGLVLDKLDMEHVAPDQAVWERVIKKMRAGTMPPAGMPRPDQATYHSIVSYLETEIDRYAATHPNAGRFARVHRLNRFEYQAAVSDLLGLDLDVSELLPMDNTFEEGFDNNESQLSVSPSLVDRYLSTARTISREAVGIAPPGPQVERYKVHLNQIQNERLSEDLPFGSQGGTAVHYNFPSDGEYHIKIRLQTNYNDYIRGMGRAHDLDVRLNGMLIKRFTIGGEDHGISAPSGYGGNIQMAEKWENYAHHADENLEVTFAAKAGSQVIGLSFVADRIEPEDIPQPRAWGFALATNEYPFKQMSVKTMDITGPLNPSGRSTIPSRARLFVCEPRSSQDEEPCARKILSTVARRAYRRPVDQSDIQPLLAAYSAGRKKGDFDMGIQYGLRELLADPSFLLRIESEPTGTEAGGLQPVPNIELASRLSFFLWSSVPDEELLNVAVGGTLSQPKVFEQQVRRMLADPRAIRSLVDSFAAQWLQLRSLNDVFRDPEIFPEFDENLRNAFEQETKLLVGHTLREDRSVAELLSANYTFLNERLARHYGIPNVFGERMRLVQLPADSPRGGLLSQGSILAVTSYANRTSPVIRGKWLMQNILGVSPPAPPPNVPPLPEKAGAGVPATVRARLEQHRKNPPCSTCHAPMDPLGFALENFDGIGMWRTTDGGAPVDASAMMPNGTKFEGPAGLRSLMLSQPDQFVSTVAGRLLQFALGRGLEYYDGPTVRKIVRDAAPNGYKWSAIILGVVNSTPFRMKAAGAEPAQTLARRGER